MAPVHDWDHMVGALERQAPMWTPGESMGYHAITYGWLVGEVIRRIDGRTCGEFVRDEIAEPLGVDFFIGLPESEDARTADLLPAPGAGPIGGGTQDNLGGAGTRPGRSPTGRARQLARVARRRVACRQRARQRTLVGDNLLRARAGRQSVALKRRPRRFRPDGDAAREDLVLGFFVRRSLGFILSTAGGRYEWGPNPRTFGHSGAGGSLGFADRMRGVGFGYVMNQMSAGLGADPRWKPIIDAVYACL